MKFTRLSQIAHYLKLSVEEREIQGFSFDSRLVKPGDLFFALKGEKFDGHDFLKEVAGKGVVAAVVSHQYKGESCGLVLLKVEDVTAALQTLAAALQAKRKQKVVGVTGSLGKTTTKEFIATLLAQKYTVAKTPGNSNSQVGLPLAVLNGKGEEEIFVAEMGMNRAGEIERLTQIVPPDIAVVTKIGYPNFEFFADGFEGIARAKAEIFSHPQTAIRILNRQVMQYEAFKKETHSQLITYALAPEMADFVLDQEIGWVVKEKGGCSPSFRLSFSANHLCENFIGAVSVARILGLSWEEIIRGAQLLKEAPLRFQRVEKEGIVFINDCYNASPESMAAALSNLPVPRYGAKTIAVLGEMVHLGNHSEARHQGVAELALKNVDHLLCVGKGCLPMIEVFNKAGKPAQFFTDLKELKSALFEITKPGDVVLVKGSNSNKMWQILE